MNTLVVEHPKPYFSFRVDKVYQGGKLKNVLSLAFGLKRFYLFLK
jgi:hypothetical protein